MNPRSGWKKAITFYDKAANFDEKAAVTSGLAVVMQSMQYIKEKAFNFRPPADWRMNVRSREIAQKIYYVQINSIYAQTAAIKEDR